MQFKVTCVRVTLLVWPLKMVQFIQYRFVRLALLVFNVLIYFHGFI